MQIVLKDIELFGFHGVHPLENKLGTTFKIDLLIETKDKNIQQLSDTIDYEKVFLILKEEFSKTEQLLEVLADRIISKIISVFSDISMVEICIFKINPPISSFQGKVGIKKSKKLN